MVIDSKRDVDGTEYLILGVTREEFDRISKGEHMVVRAVSSQEDLEVNIVLIGGETDEEIADRLQEQQLEVPPDSSLN